MTMPMSDEQTVEVIKHALDAAPSAAGSWDDVLRGRGRIRRRRLAVVSVVVVLGAALGVVIASTASDGRSKGHGRLTVAGPKPPAFEVVARASISEPYAAMTTGGGSVFAADWNSGRLLKYDATSLHLTGELRVGGPQSSVLSLAYGEGSVWAMDFSSGELLRIDPRALTVTKRTRVDGQPSEVAVGDESVWATVCCRSEHAANRQQLERIDPSTGKITGTTTLPGSGQSLQLAVGADAIAVSGETGPIRLVNPTTMTIVRSVSNPGQAPDSLAAVDGQIYALTIDNAVVRLDLVTGREPVVLRALGYDTSSNQLGGDNDLASDGHSLWLATDRQIIRIDPASGVITAHAAIRGVGDVEASPTSVYVSRAHDLERLTAHP